MHRVLARLALVALALVPFALGCEPASQEDSEIVAQDADEGQADGALQSPAPLYFEVHQDVRRCAAPACGGVFVTALQRKSIYCLDGKRSATCYVPTLDLSGLGLPAAQEAEVRAALVGQGQTVVMLGVLRKATKSAPAAFAAAEAFHANGSLAGASATWWRVSTAGQPCAYQPCENLRALKLNSTTKSTVQGVSLDHALPLAVRDQALTSAYSEAGLVVAGTTRIERNGSQKLTYVVPGLVFQRYEVAAGARLCGKDLEQALTHASAGMLETSETDAPFTYFVRPGQGARKPTASTFRTLVGAAANAKIEVRSATDFFAWSARDDATQSPREQAGAAQFRALQQSLQTQLRDVQVFRVGEITIDVYVVGSTACGDLAGLQTKVVET